MLITGYDLEVFTPPCSPGAGRFSAIARLKDDIRQVLPYLNATLRHAAYNPAAPALVWKDGAHHVVFHADHVAISNLEDRPAAVREVERLVGLVNQTWERRGSIEPSTEVRRRPTPMALYRLLPGTNCRECGQPSCWHFALRLASGQAAPEACPPLLGAEWTVQLGQLRGLVGR